MKIAIMGAGGVGGYFGGRLAAAGVDVTFIARGAHLAAIRDGGLRIESGNGDVHVRPAEATDDIASIGPVDYVFFTVKLWDTEGAGEAIRPLVGPETAVISFQNGVVAAETLAGMLGAGQVMGGVAAIGAVIAEPGLIRHTGSMAGLTFGELDNRSSGRAGALLEACREAGFDAAIADDIQQAIWGKFAFLAPFAGLTALTRQPIGPLREDSETRALLRAAIDETVDVAAARGVDLGADFAAGRMKFTDNLPAEMTSSMAQDLARGNRLELDWLSGGIARMARESGLKAPVNQFISTALGLNAGGQG
jgi:2-dehydropantoate 2-reductase